LTTRRAVQCDGPGLYEVLSQVSSLQSKYMLLLGVVGRLGGQRVLQLNCVGTECGTLVAVLVSVQVGHDDDDDDYRYTGRSST